MLPWTPSYSSVPSQKYLKKGQIRVLDHIVTEAEIVRQLQITQRAGASAKPYGVTTKSTE